MYVFYYSLRKYVISHGNQMDLLKQMFTLEIEFRKWRVQWWNTAICSSKRGKSGFDKIQTGLLWCIWAALRSAVSFAKADIWPYLNVTLSKAFHYAHRHFCILWSFFFFFLWCLLHTAWVRTASAVLQPHFLVFIHSYPNNGNQCTAFG